MSARQLLRRLVRRAAMAPLRLTNDSIRAEAIDILSSTAVASVEAPPATLRFYAPSPLLRRRAETLHSKEPDTITWLNRLTSQDVLWDVGANVGVFTLYAAAVRRCAVLAFEPSADNFFVLTRNVQLNGLADRVTAYCLALSGATRLGVLNLESAQLGGAMSQFGDAGETSRYATGTGVSHGMIGFTIDDFIRQFAPAFPSHIKLDVDGLEWPILQGAAATLRDQRMRSVMVELSLTQPGERAQAMTFLEGCGLRFISQGQSQGAHGEQAANHLFERQ